MLTGQQGGFYSQSGLLTHESSWLYVHCEGPKGKLACQQRLDTRMPGSNAPFDQMPQSHSVTGC